MFIFQLIALFFLIHQYTESYSYYPQTWKSKNGVWKPHSGSSGKKTNKLGRGAIVVPQMYAYTNYVKHPIQKNIKPFYQPESYQSYNFIQKWLKNTPQNGRIEARSGNRVNRYNWNTAFERNLMRFPKFSKFFDVSPKFISKKNDFIENESLDSINNNNMDSYLSALQLTKNEREENEKHENLNNQRSFQYFDSYLDAFQLSKNQNFGDYQFYNTPQYSTINQNYPPFDPICEYCPTNSYEQNTQFDNLNYPTNDQLNFDLLGKSYVYNSYGDKIKFDGFWYLKLNEDDIFNDMFVVNSYGEVMNLAEPSYTNYNYDDTYRLLHYGVPYVYNGIFNDQLRNVKYGLDKGTRQQKKLIEDLASNRKYPNLNINKDTNFNSQGFRDTQIFFNKYHGHETNSQKDNQNIEVSKEKIGQQNFSHGQTENKGFTVTPNRNMQNLEIMELSKEKINQQSFSHDQNVEELTVAPKGEMHTRNIGLSKGKIGQQNFSNSQNEGIGLVVAPNKEMDQQKFPFTAGRVVIINGNLFTKITKKKTSNI